jgi:hypothetical protein
MRHKPSSLEEEASAASTEALASTEASTAASAAGDTLAGATAAAAAAVHGGKIHSTFLFFKDSYVNLLVLLQNMISVFSI